MEFTKHLEGSRVVLTREARWHNTDRVSVAPVGTALQLNSWRPEGYVCTIVSGGLFNVGETFFLSREAFASAVPAGKTEKMIRLVEGGYDVCDGCVNGIEENQIRYIHINRAGEGAVICPDCAAIVMGETLSSPSWEFLQG